MLLASGTELETVGSTVFIVPTPDQMTFNGVTNSRGPSPQPCRSLTSSLSTSAGSNQSRGGWGSS